MIDAVAALLTLLSVLLYPTRVKPAAAIGALGCVLWMWVGFNAELHGVFMLNIMLFAINLFNYGKAGHVSTRTHDNRGYGEARTLPAGVIELRETHKDHWT